MTEIVVDYKGSEANSVRGLSSGNERREWRQLVTNMVGNDDDVVTELFR